MGLPHSPRPCGMFSIRTVVALGKPQEPLCFLSVNWLPIEQERRSHLAGPGETGFGRVWGVAVEGFDDGGLILYLNNSNLQTFLLLFLRDYK